MNADGETFSVDILGRRGIRSPQRERIR